MTGAQAAVAVVGVLVLICAVVLAGVEFQRPLRTGRLVRRAFLVLCAVAAVLGLVAATLALTTLHDPHRGVDPAHDLLALLRLLGFMVVGIGVSLLAREQRVTVQAGRAARPWHIAGCVALVPLGAAAVVVASMLTG